MKRSVLSNVLHFFSCLGLIFGLWGVITLVADFRDGICSFGRPFDLYGRFADYKDVGTFDAIDSDFDLSLGCYGTVENTTKRNGAVTKREYTYYYAVPVFSGSETYWIGLEVSSSNRKTMEKITDETWAYLAGEADDTGTTALSLEGCLKKMDDEMYGYMKEYFEETGYFASNAELEKYVLPVYLDTFSLKNARGLLIFGVICTLCGLLSLFYLLTENRRQSRKAQKQSGNATITVGGYPYPKSMFQNVDRLVSQHETVFAIQELCGLTGVSADEAGEVIKNWKKLY